MMRFITVCFLLCTSFIDYCFGANDSFSVYFRPGVTQLDRAQQLQIDSGVYKVILTSGTRIRITGFADEPGSVAKNKSIARNRAMAVQSYLRSVGIEGQQIECCIGLGNVHKTGNNANERRVDIIINPHAESKVQIAKPSSERKHEINQLSTLKPDETLEMNNLQFQGGAAVLLKQSAPTLYQLCDVMEENPKLKIRIEGHVCCGQPANTTQHRGNRYQLLSEQSKEWEYQLSLERAKAVESYLLDHNIAAERISCEGFGFSRPKYFGSADQLLNRRVEIRILSNR